MSHLGDYKTKDAGNSNPQLQASVPTNIHELLWDDKERTLRELISTYRLPLAVKLKSGDISQYCFNNNVSNGNSSNGTKQSESCRDSGISSGDASPVRAVSGSGSVVISSNGGSESKDVASGKTGHVDVILQVHETHRRKIILARKMTWDKRQNDYVVSGEQVEIPVSVKGWLEVVPEDGRPVEYFDSIEGIASIKPKQFLVRTTVVGYQLTTEATGNCCWMPHEVNPGEILTTGIVYVDSKKTKTAPHGNLLKRLLKQNKSKKGQELTYLQCFDSNGWEIMIPVIMSGVFSPVGDSTSANYDSVYELQDLVIAFGLPVNAQLIHANEGFHFPRGVIRFYGLREDELATVSKVGADGVLFRESSNSERFEIPVDSMLFNRGVVKKKPFIKSKLAEGFPYSHSKMTHKSKTDSLEKKEIDYVMAKSLDNIKLATTYDQKLSSSCNGKNNSTYGYNVSKYGQHMSMENKNVYSSDVCQQNKHLNKDNWTTSQSSSLPAFTPQECTNNAVSSQLDSNALHDSELTVKESLELPQRVPKELRKSRSSSILDKLSVKKVQKERAKLKELRGDDVFSKRISRNELSYQEFFNGIDNDAEDSKNSCIENSKHDDSGQGSSGGTYQSNSSNKTTVVRSTSTPNIPSKTNSNSPRTATKSTQRHTAVQKRDLPPIPTDNYSRAATESVSTDQSLSEESLYEQLPPAPRRPDKPKTSGSSLQGDVCDNNVADCEESDEDGYMVPVQVQQEMGYIKRSNLQLRNKPQVVAIDSLKSTRARQARSESPRESMLSGHGYVDRQQLDSGDLFSLAYTSTKYGENHPMCAHMGPYAASRSQYNGTPQTPTGSTNLARSLENFDHRLNDNIDALYTSRQNSRFSKGLNHDPHATLRSISLRRQLLQANELLSYTDSFPGIRVGSSLPSFKDAQDSYIQNCYDHQNVYFHNSRPQMFTSRSTDAEMMSQQLHRDLQQSNLYGSDYRMHYSESEPNFHQGNRPVSVGGLSDVFLKHGDDSAISMCSRGDAGFQNDSDYGYKGFMDGCVEDDWTPPEQLDGLTVQEVSKSLRYIGMKDRVVLRFSKERIDGSMLCTLDKKLLKEGFPELNALEIKKVLDFVQGWRPKKS